MALRDKPVLRVTMEQMDRLDLPVLLETMGQQVLPELELQGQLG